MYYISSHERLCKGSVKLHAFVLHSLKKQVTHLEKREPWDQIRIRLVLLHLLFGKYPSQVSLPMSAICPPEVLSAVSRIFKGKKIRPNSLLLRKSWKNWAFKKDMAKIVLVQWRAAKMTGEIIKKKSWSMKKVQRKRQPPFGKPNNSLCQLKTVITVSKINHIFCQRQQHLMKQ